MGYVVFGAGAIGGVVGGRLFQAGRDVTLIARGAHLEVLRSRGLRLESPAGDDLISCPAVGHPGEVAWRDDHVVLMAVKSQQTIAALTQLAGVAPPHTPILCVQNGVANEPTALRYFANVYGVWVACPASHLEPGVVHAWSTPVSGLLDIGRYPDGVDATTEAVAADLRAATFSSYSVAEIRRWKYRKLLDNLVNAIEAICGPHQRRGEVLDRVLAEAVSVLAAAGCDTATVEENIDRRGDLLQMGEIAGHRHPGSSSWQSVRRGLHDIETDYLNGEIVLLGRIHGVPTPANELLQRLGWELASHRRTSGELSRVDILALIDQTRG